MSVADDLRALTAAATPGPWYSTRAGSLMSTTTKAPVPTTLLGSDPNREFIVWCRNHAVALADLIDAAHDLGSHVATGHAYGTLTEADHADLLASAERLGRLLEADR